VDQPSSKQPENVVTPEDVKAMMIQHQKDSTLPSLLYVTRKLDEVEGVISTQVDPDKALVAIQGDLKQLYDKLVDDAGVEPQLESKQVGGSHPIGGDI